MEVHIRWMILRDMPEVTAIEASSFEFPWRGDDFVRNLRVRDCIGMVAEDLGDPDGKVVAYMVYQLEKKTIRVLNFAVCPNHRRFGVGKKMTDKLISKLSQQRRSRIELEIRESNLPGQQFFRAQGFRAYSVLRNLYFETSEDAYVFRYTLGKWTAPDPINRISSQRQES